MSRLNRFMSGLQVLDLSRHLPGPLATLLMVDFGAQVLKIEPPLGDELRETGPIDPQGRPVYFDAINAGKTCRRLDLKDGRDRAEFMTLAAKADILIESFRPGVMERLGVGYPALKALNPGLVFCSLNGFGHGSPLESTAAHDGNYLGLAGVLDRNGVDAPQFSDPPVADCTASLFALSAVLGALLARHADRQGCHLDLALADAVMPLQTFQLAEYVAAGTIPRRGHHFWNGSAAFYQVYETQDGRFVMLGAVEPKFWQAFCRAAGRPEWAPRQDEPQPQLQLRSDVAAMFRTLTAADCLARFGAADCCLTPILDLQEAVQSPHYQQRRLVRPGDDGRLQALFPAIVDGEPPDLRAPIDDRSAKSG